MTEKEEVFVEKQFSSLDLIWKLGLDELDAWADRYNKRDERFLEIVKNYVDMVKRNQENVKTITEQFSKEVKDWEKTAREELAVTTTSLQHFFPVKSYEELNQVVDDIQNKTASILLTPIQSLNNLQALDKYLDSVEQFITYRKKAREKYIDSVKKTTAVLYENQKVFVDLFSKQLKSAIFPFQKYMQNVTELTKS